MTIPNLACTIVRVMDTMTCNVNTTSNTTILRVFSGHNKTSKINSLIITNKTANATAIFNLRLNQSALVTYSLLSNVSLLANTSIQLINSDNPIYLREGDRLNAWANANGLVDVTITYEGLSDTDPNIFALLSTQIPYPAEIFAVGGGGSGPYGGGGGGSIQSVNIEEMTSGVEYVITVGAGGSAAGTTNGANSNILLPLSPVSFLPLVSALGGGYGPSGTPQNGNPGSSGGGGGGYGGGGGGGIPGLGNPGGGGGGYINGAGGGGGITGGGGGSWAYFHGGGGGGQALTIGTAPVTYGAGGAGAGGGPGGAAGTGGGGSGGAPGAPGAIIIKYAGTQRGLGGNVVFTGTHTVHTFTSSGVYKA